MRKRTNFKRGLLAVLVTLTFAGTFVACEQGVVGDASTPTGTISGTGTGNDTGTTTGTGTGSGTGTGTGTVSGTFQQQVLELTNQFRAQNGVAPLASNPLLDQSAQGYAQVMAQVNVMSHTGPDGSDPGTRIAATGYKFSTWGENIAMGYTTPQDVVNAWINSPGHRANLLNPAFKELGVGYAVGSAAYWCQDFGAE